MREGGKAGSVQGRDQKSGGDSYRFGNVIILALVAVTVDALALCKDSDQPRGGF